MKKTFKGGIGSSAASFLDEKKYIEVPFYF